jgi:hypothetical protein
MDVSGTYMGTGCSFPLVFPSPLSSPPVDYNIVANDMSNAGIPVFNPPATFLNAPPAALSTTAPSSSSLLNGQVSGNRGIFFLVGGYNASPVTSLTMTYAMSNWVWYNFSPYYCHISTRSNAASVIDTTVSGNTLTGLVSSFTLPPLGSFSYHFDAAFPLGTLFVVETCSG